MPGYTYKGKTALVTGASSGIGEAFARELAARGMDLVLVARSEDKLRALAAELARGHGIRADVIAADLGREGAAERLYDEVGALGMRVDMLLNNAGFGTHGPFETLSPDRDHAEVMLNVSAVVDLSHAFLPAMVERGDGAVINVGSTAGFQPLPYMAVYGATKAFVLSFSEALWAEYRGRGVRVLALCPGATETPFFGVVGAEEASVGRRRAPQQVVATGLRALERGHGSAIDGAFNYWLAQTPRLAPRGLTALISKRLMRPRRELPVAGAPFPATDH